MAIRTWISSGSNDANDPLNWSGSGALLPTDSLLLDGTSNVGCTLTADLGAWSWNNDSGIISGVTLGVMGITIGAGYSGTFHIATYRLALGIGGLDCSEASVATVSGSTGSAILIQGLATGESPYWISGVAAYSLSYTDLYISGRCDLRGTIGTSFPVANKPFIAIDSYVIVQEDSFCDSSGRVFGTIDVSVSKRLYLADVEIMPTGRITGDGTWYWTHTNRPTKIWPGAVIDVCYVTIYVYTGTDNTIPAGTWSCRGYFYIYFYLTTHVDPVVMQFESGTTRFDTDLKITYAATAAPADQQTVTLDFETNSSDVILSGDLTANVSGYMVGHTDAQAPGQITLEGTADQTIDSVAELTIEASKSAGIVAFLGNDYTLGDWQSTAIDIAESASIDLTGEVILDGVKQTLNGIYAGPQILDASSAPFQTVIMVGETLSLSMNF